MKVQWPNASKDTSQAHTFDADMLMQGVKEMILNKQLIYTSITKDYYGHVENFGGVTIYIQRTHLYKDQPLDRPVHNEVWIRPYADTGRMDDLEIQLEIPKGISIEIYNDWCDNRDHGLDADHKSLLEELQGRLTMAAIDANIPTKWSAHYEGSRTA